MTDDNEAHEWPYGESVVAAIRRMVSEAQNQAHTIWYAGSFVDWSHSINGHGESVLIGIDVGVPFPDYQILVTDENGKQTIYDDFDTAMAAVAWGNVYVAISRFRDQIEAMGKAFAKTEFKGLEWFKTQYNQRLPVYDQPPPRPAHHAHLIQQHIRSVRKPPKHARNPRQTMVAAVPYRQTRRHKRKIKKMEQT